VPLATYLEGQDIQAQLEWMNTEYKALASVNEPPASGTVTPLSVGQQVAKIKNLSGFPDFQSVYNNPRRSPEEKAILAEKIAEEYGVDSASVARALEQKVEQ